MGRDARNQTYPRIPPRQGVAFFERERRDDQRVLDTTRGI
jgi:hypothetical protein